MFTFTFPVFSILVVIFLINLSDAENGQWYTFKDDTIEHGSFVGAIAVRDAPIFDKYKGIDTSNNEWGGIFSPKRKINGSEVYVSVPPVTAPRSEWFYPSEFNQDKFVVELMSGKEKGFYLDIGARYWLRQSNTFALDNYYNWSGICDILLLAISWNRTCVVITDNPVSDVLGEKMKFHYKLGGAVSDKYPGDNDIKTIVTIDAILNHFKAPNVIDYFSLDIEGNEYLAMTKFPFETHKFYVATIERPGVQLHNLLVRHKYWYLKTLSRIGEVVYIHESIPNFTSIMRKYRNNGVPQWYSFHL